MNIENTQECFVQLWRRLERTRLLLGGQYKRFCIRNVLKAWFGYEATDDFIWEVCHQATVDDEPQEGWNELPLPSLYPRKHRELLRAIKRVGTNCLCLRSIRASTANCCVLSWQCGWASATTGLTCGQSTKHIALSFPKVHLLMLIRRRETPSRPPRGEGD